MKIMAIDPGDTRTGVAYSDPTGLIAGRAFTITQPSPAKLLDELCRQIETEKPDRVVLGFPVNMNGTEGPRAQKSRALRDAILSRCAVDVVLWDERGSSVTAGRILSDMGKKRQKQRARVDAVAASVILQSYLDYLALGGRA